MAKRKIRASNEVEKSLKDIVVKEECFTCAHRHENECRRFPPQVYWHPKTVRPDFVFPGVNFDMSCSEHKSA